MINCKGNMGQAEQTWPFKCVDFEIRNLNMNGREISAVELVSLPF